MRVCIHVSIVRTYVFNPKVQECAVWLASSCFVVERALFAPCLLCSWFLEFCASFLVCSISQDESIVDWWCNFHEVLMLEELCYSGDWKLEYFMCAWARDCRHAVIHSIIWVLFAHWNLFILVTDDADCSYLEISKTYTRSSARKIKEKGKAVAVSIYSSCPPPRTFKRSRWIAEIS